MRLLSRILLPASALAWLVLSGCTIDLGDIGSGFSDRYRSDFHYSYELSPDARLNVEGLNGAVEISGWDENKIDISGTKSAATEELLRDLKVEVEHSPSSVTIRTIRPSARTGNVASRYTIRVPKTMQLDRIITSNGSVHVHDVASPAHLKTSNGSIRAEHVGEVEARTSNGSIELDAVAGSAMMKTSNGRIQAENIAGHCEAETSNGSIKIHLDNAPPTPVRLSTSNGSIDLVMEEAPKSDIRMETRNSSISLRLPAETSARIIADTSNSSIASDFDFHSDLQGREHKNHVEGTIGTGGPRVDLSTSNGHITIQKGLGK